MSPNDIRARENLNPIAGGDRYFVAVNMQPLDRAGQAAQPATDDADGSREAPRLEIALLDPKEVAAEREAERRLEARRESEGHARGVERLVRQNASRQKSTAALPLRGGGEQPQSSLIARLAFY
jgi:hypothetical protein